MFIIKKYIIFIFFLNLFACNLNKIDIVHGINNLDKKKNLILINQTNKNDVINILGPVLINNKEERRWTYFEVRETKSKLGKRDIYVNNYLEIYFDKYGIVKKKDFFDLNSMKKISFSKDKIQSLGKKDTLSESLLNSTRKRLESARKKFD